MSNDPFSLNGKTILVTGATSGIGRSAAQVFTERGARVMLWSRRDTELQAALKTLHGEGHSHLSVDLNDLQSIPEALNESVNRVGKFAGLFHSAGVEYLRPLALVKEQSFSEAARVAFEAPVLIMKALSKSSARHDGIMSCVLMSSVASQRGQAAMSLYSAVRASIDAAVRSLAVELASKQVRVNSIVAGAVETAMHERITSNIDTATIEQYRQRHLLGFGQPTDIANAAAFLMSDASRWITGTALVCDGGYTCW